MNIHNFNPSTIPKLVSLSKMRFLHSHRRRPANQLVIVSPSRIVIHSIQKHINRKDNKDVGIKLQT